MVMALGLDYTSKGNGENIVPFVKYDARAGRFFRNDRSESNGDYTNTPVDITAQFKAILDLENIEIGYLKFAANSAPEYKLVKLGQPMPPKPSDDGKWKQGVRVMMKLHKDCGGDIREISSNAAAFLKGIDELHTAYEAQKGANAGKLPVVTLKTTIPVTSGSGDKKSTNYQPVFEIVGWAARPNDLKHVAKQIASPSVAPTNGAAAVAAPPATGSTQVPPPAQKKQEPAAVDDGFG
jgi:hypothetical protein